MEDDQVKELSQFTRKFIDRTINITNPAQPCIQHLKPH